MFFLDIHNASTPHFCINIPHSLATTSKQSIPCSAVIRGGGGQSSHILEFVAGSLSCEPRLMGQHVQEQQRDMQKELRGKIEIGINELKEYRSQCLMNGLGYYDAFKNNERSNLDFHANLKRLELAALWDEIGLLENFQYGEDWRRLATHYMLLVEPLDIANYYRLGKNEDSGPYLTHGRPRRYKSFHKWLEDDEENNQLLSLPAGTDQLMLTQDSCLWAYVEEITYLIGENIVGDQENLVAEFEERLRRLFDSNGLCMEELVCGKSTFKMAVKWLWDRKTPQKKTGSCLCCIIDKHPELLE